MNELIRELEKSYCYALGAHVATNDSGASEALGVLCQKIDTIINELKQQQKGQDIL